MAQVKNTGCGKKVSLMGKSRTQVMDSSELQPHATNQVTPVSGSSESNLWWNGHTSENSGNFSRILEFWNQAKFWKFLRNSGNFSRKFPCFFQNFIYDLQGFWKFDLVILEISRKFWKNEISRILQKKITVFPEFSGILRSLKKGMVLPDPVNVRNRGEWSKSDGNVITVLNNIRDFITQDFSGSSVLIRILY